MNASGPSPHRVADGSPRGPLSCMCMAGGVDLGRSETATTHRPLSLSARVTGAPRIRRPHTSAHSKHADACDSCVAGSVIWRSRINPSEAETPGINRKYYRPFSRRSLSGAAFRAMTGRTVNPQVPGSSPGRGAKSINRLRRVPASLRLLL